MRTPVLGRSCRPRCRLDRHEPECSNTAASLPLGGVTPGALPPSPLSPSRSPTSPAFCPRVCPPPRPPPPPPPRPLPPPPLQRTGGRCPCRRTVGAPLP